MLSAVLSSDDHATRLRLVEELRALRPHEDEAFDAITRLACRLLACPMSAVVLGDGVDAWVKARHGFAEGTGARSSSAQALLAYGDEVDLQYDAAPQDAGAPPSRSADATSTPSAPHTHASNPETDDGPRPTFMLPATQARFRAETPIVVDDWVVGVLEVFDTTPRSFTEDDRQALADLGQVAARLLESRLHEQRSRLQEARVRTASRAGSDGLWETDASGRLTWVSESAQANLGARIVGELGKYLADMPVHSTGQHRLAWDRLRSAEQKREPFVDLVFERQTADGEVLVSLSGVPVLDSHGEFRGYRGAAREVTSEMKAREVARRAERLLHEAVETFHAAVMVTDARGDMVVTNSTWRQHVGQASDQAGGNWPLTLRRLVGNGEFPDAAGNEETFIEALLVSVHNRRVRRELRWRDRWMLASAHRMTDGHVVHLALDITSRKHAELALVSQRSELLVSDARTRAVLDAVPDLWFVVDEAGTYLECSAAHHPLLIRPWAEMAGQPFDVGAPAPLVNLALPAIRCAVESGERQRIVYQLVTSDGIEHSFEARLSPMPGRRVLYVVRDLTELRALERNVLILQRAFEADASVPISVVDCLAPDMPFTYVNSAFKRLTGYSEAELLGPSQQLRPDSAPQQMRRHVRRHPHDADQGAQVRLASVRKNGSRFIDSMQLLPVHDAEGRATHFIGIHEDVTAQSLAAEKLRRSEELYRSVAATISDGLVVVSTDGVIVAINPAGCAVLGASEEELVGKRQPLMSFTLIDAHSRPLAGTERPVEQVLAGGLPVVARLLGLVRPDGQTRWLDLSCHPLTTGGPGGRSVVVTFRDITQQRQAEQSLALAEERWKFALEGSGQGVWDWDIEHHSAFYSVAWKSIFGHADDEVGNSADEWLRRIHSDDLQNALQELHRHLRGETPVYQGEYRMRHRDGHDLWIHNRGQVVSRTADGRARRLVGTVSDVTANRNAAQALRDKQAAELASSAKSEFLSRMSHEMRTPLNAVIGFSQLLRSHRGEFDKRSVNEYADHVLRAGQHLLALINDVLDLQQVEQGRLGLDIGVVSLDEAVERTIDFLRPMAHERCVVLQNLVPRGVRVHGDARRLQQVLLNLASNAVKYNRPGGRVRLALEPDMGGEPQERVLLSIEDNGPGMSPQQTRRLFQPFERLGRETSAIEGTGLGLIIARSLVEEMKGAMTVKSQLGAGTRIVLDLPRAADAQEASVETDAGAGAPAVVDAPSSDEAARAPAIRMLYVEDNRINAILFEEAIRLRGHVELRVAEDGVEALEIVQDWLPQVLVLDAHLPGMTGFEVLQQLRSLPGLAHTPAFMCSADAMPDDLARARSAGFIGYWTKPIDFTKLFADLDQLEFQAGDSL
ncbi:MAG: hypothetical protein JWP52_349 [Rhizobacter sp.]|nr:hypothetical protein [Rhizobacter sp.]